MGSKTNIDESLAKTREYVERLGDTVEDAVSGATEDEPLRGLACQHGTHSYVAVTAESWEWIQLRYPLNVDQLYAIRRLADPDQLENFQISDAQIQQARSEFDDRLDDMPLNEKREFRMNLIHMLSRQDLIVELDTTKPLNIHGFNIDKQLFINEDSFSIADFQKGLQQIINLGWVGKEFFLDNYGFRRLDDSGPSDPDRHGNRR